ncbi:HU family DNA-binding protein [Sphingomonas sp. PB2P19]|uniref:HU family DNA-binding protein n=1 Tax=Sphingomonas rhamnosi TaxID=3096156 RepID=UPI003FA7313E
MIRKELIRRIVDKNPSLRPEQVEQCVRSVFSCIAKGLLAGDRVELRGFGVFSVRSRRVRMGLQAGASAQTVYASYRVPHFKASRMLLPTIQTRASTDRIPANIPRQLGRVTGGRR